MFWGFTKMSMSMGSFASRVVATVVVATDGSGDYTDVQEGIDSLPAGGGVVYIKEGTYTISTGLLINVSNTAIMGAGKATILQASGNTLILRAASLSGLLIQNIYFLGTDNIGHDVNYGIRFTTVTKSSIIGCWFEHCTSGIFIRTSSAQLIISDNIIIDSVFSGVIFNDSTKLTLANNVSDENGQAGILAGGTGSGSSIIGNQCNSNTNSGISVGTYSSGRIIGNYCDSNSKDGITLSSACDQNVIIGNTCIDNSSGEGIAIDNANCDNNILVGNVATGNGTNFIDLGTNTRIAHNVDV